MAKKISNKQIIINDKSSIESKPKTLVQSPYLYLQTTGSDGQDGSSKGFHLRWDYLRNLGATHLPKGNLADTSVNFNRKDDFVHIMRSRYETRFPTIIDFAVQPPDLVVDAQYFWIYTNTNTATVVYIHFRDHSKYNNSKTAFNPLNNTLGFIEKYGNGLIEVEVKDKLFFAAEIEVKVTGQNPIIRTEAVSVYENLPVTELFVSCRKMFTNDDWCGGIVDPKDPKVKKVKALQTREPRENTKQGCCDGKENLITNGNFEEGVQGFQTDYKTGIAAQDSTLWVDNDPRNINANWQGSPYSGKSFLIVDGATKPDFKVWQQTVKIKPGTTYCFSGAVSTLYGTQAASLEFVIKSSDGILKSFFVDAPVEVNLWELFHFEWSSGARSTSVDICIIDRNTNSLGNDFGLDDLWMCEKSECQPRIVSENIRFIRFDSQHSIVRRIEIETYEDYIVGAKWSTLNDKFSLSNDDNMVIERWLENGGIQVHDQWPKFNDGAKVNIFNYKDRWHQSSGIKMGVLQYIALSNTDPKAIANLPGDQSVDGSVEVSYLDMLKLVALDFHVARMLGQGTIDQPFEDYEGPYIYLAQYRTDGLLDVDTEPFSTNHLYMSVPTKQSDYRLPEEPVLKPLKYGLYIDNGQANPSPLTDANGYTPDGQIRFITTFIEQEATDPVLTPFFNPSELYCAIDKTNSVFFGMEYRKVGEALWRKPEIAHDPNYKDTGSPGIPETNPIPNSGDENKSVLVHEEREAGFHEYAAYGINWFSRPSGLSNKRQTDKTVFVKANTLIPPANFQVQLIQVESPLLLTTAQEQTDLANTSIVTGPDKTYIRVTFDYFHTHDINYQFGNQVKLFFRENSPQNVRGEIKSVVDDGTNPKLSITRTKSYTINGEVISPSLPISLMAQFIGGLFSSDGKRFIIQDVNASAVPGEGPIFTLRKIIENTAVAPGGGGPFMTSEVLIAPEAGKTFLAIENMADSVSWGTNNPLGKVIQLGDPSWSMVTETYVEEGETISRQLRGIWETANISDVPETGTGNIIGVYKIQFQTYQLPNHAQAGDDDAVNWYKGVVRVAKAGDPTGVKKVLEVIKVEEIGTSLPLRIIAVDNSYDAGDPIQSGSSIIVNYYPGYRAYLLADQLHDLDEVHILPGVGEGHKKTWMGAVSYDSLENYSSGVGIPAPLIALEFVEPFAPEGPSGREYATRPDFYYKSTYTFNVQFTHQPFAAAFYRAGEDAILRSLYNDNTIVNIRTALKQLGDEDPYRADRWKNLISFDYVYSDSSKPYYDPTGSNPNGTFRRFPREAGNFRFPKPDKAGVFDGIQEPGLVLNKVKDAIYEIFTPLTAQPLLYQYIKGGTYQPVPKSQTIRDKFGDLLDPTNSEFDQAPMAKNLGGNKIQFTDFTLDGSSNMLYFYLCREIGNRGKMSDPSPIAGPIFLINTKPGDAPGIKKLYTVPKGRGTINPSIEFEVNGYAGEQKIRKLEIYRTSLANDALTVRTMKKVKTIDLVGNNMDTEANYKIRDDFENEQVPYGDPLFYRIIALREVKNAQGAIEWAPSKPSKLLMTSMIDTENPQVPEPKFTSDLPSGIPASINNVVISWESTVYNGTYYMEKMNSSGNWNTIYIIKSNDHVITVDLNVTDLGSNVLIKSNDNGEVIYHRFRVRVENSSGLFGLEDKVLRI